MPSTSSAALRRALVAELEKQGAVRTAAVRRAFLRVPRERFVPEIAARDGLARVYANEALVTRTPQGGFPTSSSSQPSIMAEMLERLDLRPGLRVLEIGTGTGYNAALLSLLVGPKGRVTSVDLQWDLADKAAKALRAGGYPVEVLVGDAQHGRFGDGPYDRIILTASTDHVPPVWFEQLAPGGLIEMPMRLGPAGPFQQLVATLQRVEDRLQSVAVVGGGFMFLRSAGDGGGEQRPPTVTVDEVIDGRHRTFASVVGPGLLALKPAARRRLAALLASTPRTRSFPSPGGATNTVVPFLALSEPRRGVVVGFLRERVPGIGVAAKDGRGLALVVAGKPDRFQVLSYGENGAAAGLLADELARWRQLGRPALGDWSIEVTFGERAPRPSGHARVLRRGDCWITVSWPPPGSG